MALGESQAAGQRAAGRGVRRRPVRRGRPRGLDPVERRRPDVDGAGVQHGRRSAGRRVERLDLRRGRRRGLRSRQRRRRRLGHAPVGDDREPQPRGLERVAVRGGRRRGRHPDEPGRFGLDGRPTGIGFAFRDVAWSGSRFVAVGDSGSVSYSADGIHWTTADSGTRDQFNAVTWTGSRFVVAALGFPYEPRTYASVDGASWRLVTGPRRTCAGSSGRARASSASASRARSRRVPTAPRCSRGFRERRST